jgi:hypothetical protein
MVVLPEYRINKRPKPKPSAVENITQLKRKEQ